MSTELDKLPDDDLSRAILSAMWPIPRLIVTGVIPVKQPEIDNARSRCKDLRSWLQQQEMTTRVRRAYEHWIEFCERSIVEAEDELRTGRKRREFEEGQRRFQNRQQVASAAASLLPKPPR